MSTAAVQSPADQANLALVRMGYKLRVGSLFDGSFAAKKLLDVYSQTRDELLSSFDWQFAERNAVLTPLKSAPVAGYIPPTVWNPATNPPLPWLFEYQLPADFLKMRMVKQTPLFVPNFDPQPNQPAIANDTSLSPPQRVILSNLPNAVIVYTGQITDPTTWDVRFVELFAASLGRHLAPVLVGMEGAKMEGADEAQATSNAEMQNG